MWKNFDHLVYILKGNLNLIYLKFKKIKFELAKLLP